MTDFEKDIINLIQSALNDTTPNKITSSYKSILNFAIKQQIVGLLFYPLSKLNDFTTSDIYSEFFDYYVSCLNISENQSYEIDNLFKAFNVGGINYVPLKGVLLKELYPQKEMRTMSDADILIKIDQIEKIGKIIKECGFKFIKETDHELIWTKDDALSVELHKQLVPTSSKDFNEYYGDGWKLVKDNKMSEEDTFIFLFTHFAKHYRGGGVGIKYVVDFYVYLNRYKNINTDYIENELKKLKLYEFYLNIKKVLGVWFNEEESTEKSDYITNFLFLCYVYGETDLHRVSEGLRLSKTSKNAKLKKVINWFFPPYAKMRNKYKVLKKVPVLLPIIYVYRWFEILITEPIVTIKKVKKLKVFDESNIKDYQKGLNYVGLDFNFDDED